LNGILDMYSNDIQIEDYEDNKEPELEEDGGVFVAQLEEMIDEDNKEPELEEDDGVFIAQLEDMIDELKKWNLTILTLKRRMNKFRELKVKRKSEKFKNIVKSDKWNSAVSKITKKGKWVHVKLETELVQSTHLGPLRMLTLSQSTQKYSLGH
jgi:hypothetical protein